MSRRRAALLTAAYLMSAAAAHAQAADGSVRIDATRCPSLPADRIVELVSLELTPRAVHDVSAVPHAAIEAEVSCDGGLAVMHVRTRDGGRALRLELPLSDTAPHARTRLLALTLAELIVSSTLPGAAPMPEPEPEPEPAPDAADRHHAPSLLWLGASAALQGDPGLLTPGLQLGVLLSPARGLDPLALLLDLDGQLGSTREGTADLRMQTLSAAAALALRLPLGPLEAALGAGVRGGYARLSAETPEPGLSGRSLGGPFLGPALIGALHVPTGTILAMHAALTFDHALLSVRGLDNDGERLLSLQGPRVTASLGLSLALDR